MSNRWKFGMLACGTSRRDDQGPEWRGNMLVLQSDLESGSLWIPTSAGSAGRSTALRPWLGSGSAVPELHRNQWGKKTKTWQPQANCDWDHEECVLITESVLWYFSTKSSALSSIISSFVESSQTWLECLDNAEVVFHTDPYITRVSREHFFAVDTSADGTSRVTWPVHWPVRMER